MVIIPKNIRQNCSHEPGLLCWQSNIFYIFVRDFFYQLVKCFRFWGIKPSFLQCLCPPWKKHGGYAAAGTEQWDLFHMWMSDCDVLRQRQSRTWHTLLPTWCRFPSHIDCNPPFPLCLWGRKASRTSFPFYAGLWSKPVWADHHRHRWGSLFPLIHNLCISNSGLHAQIGFGWQRCPLLW